jgi:hypothetical protein
VAVFRVISRDVSRRRLTRVARRQFCSSPSTSDSPMHLLIGRLIVTFVLCLICFIAYSSQIFVIWPWYGRVVSVELLMLLVPFK